MAEAQFGKKNPEAKKSTLDTISENEEKKPSKEPTDTKDANTTARTTSKESSLPSSTMSDVKAKNYCI